MSENAVMLAHSSQATTARPSRVDSGVNWPDADGGPDGYEKPEREAEFADQLAEAEANSTGGQPATRDNGGDSISDTDARALVGPLANSGNDGMNALESSDFSVTPSGSVASPTADLIAAFSASEAARDGTFPGEEAAGLDVTPIDANLDGSNNTSGFLTAAPGQNLLTANSADLVPAGLEKSMSNYLAKVELAPLTRSKSSSGTQSAIPFNGTVLFSKDATPSGPTMPTQKLAQPTAGLPMPGRIAANALKEDAIHEPVRVSVTKHETHFPPVALMAPGLRDAAVMPALPPVNQIADSIRLELGTHRTNAAQEMLFGRGAKTSAVKILEIELQPASLGKLTVQISLRDDMIQLKFDASRKDTARLIEQNQSQLVQLLRREGYSIDVTGIKILESNVQDQSTTAPDTSIDAELESKSRQSSDTEYGGKRESDRNSETSDLGSRERIANDVTGRDDTDATLKRRGGSMIYI